LVFRQNDSRALSSLAKFAGSDPQVFEPLPPLFKGAIGIMATATRSTNELKTAWSKGVSRGAVSVPNAVPIFRPTGECYCYVAGEDSAAAADEVVAAFNACRGSHLHASTDRMHRVVRDSAAARLYGLAENMPRDSELAKSLMQVRSQLMAVETAGGLGPEANAPQRVPFAGLDNVIADLRKGSHPESKQLAEYLSRGLAEVVLIPAKPLIANASESPNGCDCATSGTCTLNVEETAPPQPKANARFRGLVIDSDISPGCSAEFGEFFQSIGSLLGQFFTPADTPAAAPAAEPAESGHP
jgi:hypothetical protein